MTTKPDVPIASELRAAARGHDPLGLSTDLEALVALVHAARRQLLAERTPETFWAWLALVADLSAFELERRVGLRAQGASGRWPAIDPARDGFGARRRRRGRGRTRGAGRE